MTNMKSDESASVLPSDSTFPRACRERRLKWAPSAWGYSWANHLPGVYSDSKK